MSDLHLTVEQILLKAAAEARADAAFDQGVADIEAVAAVAPDWEITDDATGRKLLSPAGQMARGMLDHLRRHSTRYR